MEVVRDSKFAKWKGQFDFITKFRINRGLDKQGLEYYYFTVLHMVLLTDQYKRETQHLEYTNMSNKK